jgi:hypothetical protein
MARQKQPEPIRGVPYTPEQARSSAKSLTMIAAGTSHRTAAANYAALAQTLLDYADLREAEQAEVSDVAL